jgi:adenosine/AMP kinase
MLLKTSAAIKQYYPIKILAGLQESKIVFKVYAAKASK